MKRLMAVVVVALVMAAMILVMVAPAMARGDPCPRGEHPSAARGGGGPPLFTCVPTGRG